MCTSFVFRKENVLIGMNFDNDGKKFRVTARPGRGFMVSVEVNGNFYPSFGVSSNGLFVNNLMVDSNGEGRYKRQNDRRWVNSSLVDRVMEGNTDIDTLRAQVEHVEIVNGPFMSTHNMITDRTGRTLVVEPGRRSIFTSKDDSGWYVMTNFPLSGYSEPVPCNPEGTGADRFISAVEYLSTHTGPLTMEQGFELLRQVRQHGPDWKTELSMIFDPAQNAVFYQTEDKPDTINRIEL